MSTYPSRTRFPAPLDLVDLLDPFQLLLNWKAPTQPFGIRLETVMDENVYVVRAELPGIDPDKDVEVTVTGGVLTIQAERAEQTGEQHRSEFRYGTYSRSLRLPDGTKPEEITASYRGGILTIRVGMARAAKPVSHRIAVERAE